MKSAKQNWQRVVDNVGLVRKVIRMRFPWVLKDECSRQAYDDFVQIGLFGLLRAVQKHKKKKGKLSTYSIPWIINKIQRERFLYTETGIRIPAYIVDKLGKKDEHEKKNVIAARKVLNKTADFEDVLTLEGIEYEPKDDLMDLIRGCFEVLTSKEEAAVIMRFGLDDKGERTYREIGAVYGVTCERARQIVNIALKKLKSRMKAKGIKYEEVA